MKITIEGLDEIQEALRKLPDSTAKGVIRRVLKSRAQPIADHARQLVPVDEGHLRNSIRVGTKLTRRQKRAHVKRDPSDVEMFIGAGPHPQAHMQEFGTSQHGAQPYLRPAWDAGKMRLLEGIKDDMWKEIRKTAERRAKRAAKAGK